jgi:hypothetical protein
MNASYSVYETVEDAKRFEEHRRLACTLGGST